MNSKLNIGLLTIVLAAGSCVKEASTEPVVKAKVTDVDYVATGYVTKEYIRDYAIITAQNRNKVYSKKISSNRGVPLSDSAEVFSVIRKGDSISFPENAYELDLSQIENIYRSE